jgi:vacuolar-type H+-ATPase subunit I/STV1
MSTCNPRTFEVRHRGVVRQVTVTRTDAEAAAICSASNDSFGRDLAKRFGSGKSFSNLQLAWLHVKADELAPKPVTPKVNQAKVASEATIKTAARRTANRTRGTGIDAFERRISQLQKVVEKLSGRIHQIQYDIPEQYGNPSDALAPHAIRMSDSVWMIAEELLDHPEVQAVIQLQNLPGVIMRVSRWADDEVEKIRGWAVEDLRNELIRLNTALITNIDNAHKRIAEAEEAFDKQVKAGEIVTRRQREEVVDRNHFTIKGHIAKAKAALEASIQRAMVYDDNEQTADLIAGLRATIAAQREAHNALLRTQGARASKYIPE